MSTDGNGGGSSTKIVLIIVGVVGGVLVLCVLGCIGVFYLAARTMKDLSEKAMERIEAEQAARPAADAFLADLGDGKVEAAYKQTTQAYKSRVTLQEFKDLVDKNPTMKKRTNSWVFAQTHAPDLVVFQGTVNAPQGSVNCTIHVAKEGETWRVDRFSIP